MSKWEPIDTAPKDGTEVLVYAAPLNDIPSLQSVVSWHQDHGWSVDKLREVTHWMPLPDTPEEKNEVLTIMRYLYTLLYDVSDMRTLDEAIAKVKVDEG